MAQTSANGPELRTLFLQAPSFEGFDGGAGSRYQARREVHSFWYPSWRVQLRAAPAVDFGCGEEFDYTCQEVAAGRALADVNPHGVQPPYPHEV